MIKCYTIYFVHQILICALKSVEPKKKKKITKQSNGRYSVQDNNSSNSSSNSSSTFTHHSRQLYSATKMGSPFNGPQCQVYIMFVSHTLVMGTCLVLLMCRQQHKYKWPHARIKPFSIINKGKMRCSPRDLFVMRRAQNRHDFFFLIIITRDFHFLYFHKLCVYVCVVLCL